MPFNLSLIALYNTAPQAEMPALQEALGSAGYRIYNLDGSTIDSKASFLTQAAADLPQAEPTRPAKNYSALSDNLWQSLHEAPGKNVAIVWQHADMLLNADVREFLTITDLFAALIKSIAAASDSARLILVLAGEGNNFKPSF